MSFTTEIHNKKSLAERYGFSYKQFLKKLEIMLSDADINREFGIYQQPFTPKQLRLIEAEFGNPDPV